MRNLKSSSTVELVITPHLAFGHENQPRVRWALLYCYSIYFCWNVSYTFQWCHVNCHADTLLVNTRIISCGEIKQFYPNMPVRESDLREGKGKEKPWASGTGEGTGSWRVLCASGGRGKTTVSAVPVFLCAFAEKGWALWPDPCFGWRVPPGNI